MYLKGKKATKALIDGTVVIDEKEQEAQQKEEYNDDYSIKVYKRRWLVLAISVLTRVLRGFNQSCYGVINDVLVGYLKVQPAHIDWLLLSQSVTFLILSIPLSWLMCRIGFRKIYLFMITTITAGFALIAFGFWVREFGYPAVLIGQLVIGVSNIISGTIPPLLASVWFPLHEVPTAIACNIAGRGIGETLGSILMPKLLTKELLDTDLGSVGNLLVFIFGSSAFVSAIIMIIVAVFVTDRPPTPPSVAQFEMQKRDLIKDSSFRDSLKMYGKTAVSLFTDRYFVTIFFAAGAVLPVTRYSSILLSSILQDSFRMQEPDELNLMNLKTGYALTAGWIAYTICGYTTGPVISHTRAYNTVFSVGAALVSLSCLSLLYGVQLTAMPPIYVGVVGFSIGIAISSTASFELLIEVTYPNPILLVATINGLGLGVSKLLYSVIGRYLLEKSDSVAAWTYPMGMTLIAAFLLHYFTFPLKRTEAENSRSSANSLVKCPV